MRRSAGGRSIARRLCTSSATKKRFAPWAHTTAQIGSCTMGRSEAMTRSEETTVAQLIVASERGELLAKATTKLSR